MPEQWIHNQSWFKNGNNDTHQQPYNKWIWTSIIYHSYIVWSNHFDKKKMFPNKKSLELKVNVRYQLLTLGIQSILRKLMGYTNK